MDGKLSINFSIDEGRRLAVSGIRINGNTRIPDADIVGAMEGFERLGVEAVYHLPVAVGHGWVEAAHGKLPVPAPATAILLEGVELASGGPVEGEATTPTGAALLRVLSAGAPPSRWRMVGSGWGAGQRDPKHYPNALRVIRRASAERVAPRRQAPQHRRPDPPPRRVPLAAITN